MSTTTTTDESCKQSPTSSTPSFTDWRPSREKEPTEKEEREARERTLEKGNETEIHWKKAPKGKRQYYERLDLHNRDCYWQFRDEVDVSRDCDNQHKSHLLQAFADELGLTALQRRKALNRLFELDLQGFGMRTDVVAFCLCGIVLKEEVAERYDDDSPYHPQRNPENNPDNFALVESRLIKESGRTTRNYIQKVWGKLLYGNLPTRSDDDWKQFIQSHSQIQTHPSHPPDHIKA